MVTLFQRAFWFALTLVTLVAFAVAIPRLPSLGPDTRHLLEETPVQLTAASVTLPAGWDLDIAAASHGQPVASFGEVRVGVSDAVWLGASDRLVEHVESLTFSAGARLPDVPADADGTEAEQWRIVPRSDATTGDPRVVYVLRRDTAVVLVVVSGPATDVAAASGAIDAIVASVTIDGFALDVGAGS